MNRAEILARIDSSWQELLQVIDGVPVEHGAEPGVAGEWSARDILGHLAYWEDRAAAALEGADAASGGQMTIDEINAAEYERISRLTYGEALEALRQSHDRIVAVATSAESLTAGDVEGDTWEHYEEHGADIRRWRERNSI